MPYTDKEAQKEYHREYYARHRTELLAKQRAYNIIHRQPHLEARYGLTGEAFQAMMNGQQSLCAICHQELVPGLETHVDHDHACCPGRKSCGSCVRGVLCRECNRGLGAFSDDPVRLASAIKYLGEHHG